MSSSLLFENTLLVVSAEMKSLFLPPYAVVFYFLLWMLYSCSVFLYYCMYLSILSIYYLIFDIGLLFICSTFKASNTAKGKLLMILEYVLFNCGNSMQQWIVVNISLESSEFHVHSKS